MNLIWGGNNSEGELSKGGVRVFLSTKSYKSRLSEVGLYIICHYLQRLP